MTIPDPVLLAIVTFAFAAGGAIAYLRSQVAQALRAARRAHKRIDELEESTGQHTTLRG